MQLEHVEWMLDAAGVEQFIDWLESFEAGRDHRLRGARASCHVGHQFVAAEKRFQVRKAEIARAGIGAKLFRAGKGLEHSCGCDDPDTDGSEGNEDNDDCPWF